MHFLLPPSLFEFGIFSVFALFLLLNWRKVYIIEKRYPFLHYNRRAFLFKSVLRLLTISCVIVALLAPFKKIVQEEVSADNHHLYLLVDLSNSMRVQDTPPGRFERTKYTLSQIIQQTNGSYCIILFTNEALIYCPLTHDKEAILDLYIPPMTFGLTSGGGSNISQAYALAMENVKKNHKEGIKNSIICFSDWESSELPAASLFREATLYNLSFYQVVVGSVTGEYIPWQGGVLKKDGRAVISKAMPENANKLCRKLTDCRVYQIAPEVDDTATLIRNINENSTTITNRQHIATDNIYHMPLLLAILFLILDLSFPLPLIHFKR
jgi:hypothetical protein